MPKKIEPDEEYDEEEEEEEEDLESPPAQKIGRGRPMKKQLPPLPKRPTQRPQPAEPQKRYTAFLGNDVGIADAETNEALTGVSGIVNLEQRQLLISLVFVLLQGQADIIERLERIENAIGVMQEG